MRNYRITLVIIGLLLSFVTTAADNSPLSVEDGKANLVGKTYSARVIAQKAIVYADENMLSPLGYISSGKGIVVGNPRRMNKDLVPIVIYGRLGFIEIKDIVYDDSPDDEFNIKRGAPREHDFDLLIQKPEERLSENNSIYFSIHNFTAGSDVKRVFAAVDGAEKSSFLGYQMQLIHRKEASRFFWGAGIEYASVSTVNMNFAYFMLNPTMGYTPIKNPLFLIDVYASLDLALSVEYRIDNNDESEPHGYIWGPQAAARIVFFPEAKYHITGGASIRKYNVTGLIDLKDNNQVPVAGIQDILGVGISIGFGMEF